MTAVLSEKPTLRGVFHQIGAVVAVVCGASLALWAPTPRGALAAALYAMSLVVLFGVSATYHRVNWRTPEARARMRRADHASIFVLIAGTYTPIAIAVLPEALGRQMLLIVWIGAGIGVLQSLFWIHAPKAVAAVIAVALGWVVVAFWDEATAALTTREMTLIFIGGVAYTLGAVAYALKRPNPIPGVLGYHEVFHGLTIVAATLHFTAIAWMVARAA